MSWILLQMSHSHTKKRIQGRENIYSFCFCDPKGKSQASSPRLKGVFSQNVIAPDMLKWLVIPNPLVFVKLNTLGAIMGTTATRITKSTHCTSVTSIKWKPFLQRIKLVWRKHIILHILCTYFPRNMTFISYLEWSVIRTWVASVTGSLKRIFSLTLEV